MLGFYFIEDESQALYNELFSDTTLEMAKMLSKEERDRRSLNEEKVSKYIFYNYFKNLSIYFSH